ncbi:hypothetical protein GCM10017673_51110 [Streptosporangium violaceochromogenes]|nr:hypothetical protein GCM10017673_51110 [Streptosporangium violaceochromogenes]
MDLTGRPAALPAFPLPGEGGPSCHVISLTENPCSTSWSSLYGCTAAPIFPITRALRVAVIPRIAQNRFKSTTRRPIFQLGI